MRKEIKEIRIHKYRIGIVIVSLAVLTLFCACGVKSYPYLAPPPDSSIFEPLENDKLFSFYNYTENNTNYFLGYEVYYKFYSSDPASSKYENEREQLELTDTYEKLISLGYRRLYNKDDVFGKPLIPFDAELAEQAVLIQIDFRFLTELIYPTIQYSESTIEAARYVQQSGDLQENVYNFNSEQISSDFTDIPPTIVTSETETLYLSLYVMSYGKYEVFNELHSDVAHLGKITLQTENALF